MAKMHPPPHHEHPHGETALAGRAAVVTGASSGIGRAIALELAAHGADVFLHARGNRAELEATAAAAQDFGRATATCLADLRATDACEGLVNQAFAWRNEINIWVNNAGTDVLTGTAKDLPFEEKLHLLWQVDVLATIRLSRMVGPRMQTAGTPHAVILNMGWDQAASGMEGDAGEMFGPIKGAVMAFTKSLAKSLAPQVRVNCLAPGWIKTGWGEEASVQWQQRAKSESLLARWGTPEDVARVARFLATDDASFLTGQIVAINGGLRTS